jgi:hypothetical protein
LALFGWQFVGALGRGGTARTKRPDHMRHPPNAILVGDKKVVSLPREPVRLVQVFDVAIDPLGVTRAVVAQERDVARALLHHQYVAVGEDEQPARVGEPGRERRGAKTRRHLQGLPGVRNDQ